MNLSVEQAKHDRLSDRQAQLHFNQERFALELATTEVRNRIAREQSEIRHEEVDPESIGSGMSWEWVVELDENDVNTNRQINELTHHFMEELTRILSQVPRPTEEGDPNRFRCTGYNQFLSSLHCQFFHSGTGVSDLWA